MRSRGIRQRRAWRSSAVEHLPQGPRCALDLALEVQPLSKDGSASVFPLGAAQFGVVFHTVGAYRMLASKDGNPIDGITVEVGEPARIDLSTYVYVRTEDGSCISTSESYTGLSQLTLHRNQAFRVHVVPYDSEGQAMLGLLSFSATASPGISLDAPLFGELRMANSIEIRVSRPRDGTAAIYVTDEHAKEVLEVEFETTTDKKEVLCH
jgi:hypothetical protein